MEWENRYFALLELIGTPAWEWEPKTWPQGCEGDCGQCHPPCNEQSTHWWSALGAWYALSLDCVNAREIVGINTCSRARVIQGFMPFYCLLEDVKRGWFAQERDLLTESYEAGLCAGGWADMQCLNGVDWVSNARRRTACWRDDSKRQRHLAELDSAEYRARLERLPDYWRPPPVT